MEDKNVWRIFVPRFSNQGLEYQIDYHREWDKRVRDIAGGVTILRTARGQWVNPEGAVFAEEMIPVEIYCDEPSIDSIIQLTMDYYDQEAIFAYKASFDVKLVHRKRQ